MLGTELAHYKIVSLLGRGGMGEVYLARDLLLNRQVALKFLLPDRQPNHARLKRFFREAKSIASLDHPNICAIYDLGTSPAGAPYIVMPYYEGTTIREKIEDDVLKIDEAVALILQVLQGLGKAHEAGIVHRDIKPGNLIVTADGVVKILDFGVVKIEQGDSTDTIGVIGTAPYMSPEQLSGTPDHRSDLWACGVVLYEMLTGRQPFCADTIAEATGRILHEEPPNAHALRPDISQGLSSAIRRALEKDPNRRYQSAQSMIEALAPYAGQHSRDSVSVSRPLSAWGGGTDRGPSIAVLPFTNIGGNEAADYFSDGLTEEMIHAFSRLSGIRVVSRTSAFQFKGKGQDVRVIAGRLGVSSILEGSVRLAGKKLRVTVVLTNARDGCSLWSRRFDRDLADVFAIQEDIATAVAELLCETLTHENTARLRSRPSSNVESWSLCLRARHQWHQARPDSFERARVLYEEAVKIDAGCSAAFAGLADYYRTLAFWGIVDPRQVWPAARQFAAKAIELNPLMPQPRITMARYLQHMDRNRGAAEVEFRRAIDLDPGDSEPHVAWGVFLVQERRFDEALGELRRARDLDPLNLLIAVGVAWLHCYRGEHERALTECLKARELNPDYLETFGCMAWICEQQGRFADAESWLQRAVDGSARSPISLAMLGRHYAIYGNPGKAREVLGSLREMSSQRYVSPLAFAFVLAALGESETALDYLEQAYECHDSLLSYARVYTPFEPLRDHPRFVHIVTKLGLLAETDAPPSVWRAT